MDALNPLWHTLFAGIEWLIDLPLSDAQKEAIKLAATALGAISSIVTIIVGGLRFFKWSKSRYFAGARNETAIAQALALHRDPWIWRDEIEFAKQAIAEFTSGSLAWHPDAASAVRQLKSADATQALTVLAEAAALERNRIWPSKWKLSQYHAYRGILELFRGNWSDASDRFDEALTFTPCDRSATYFCGISLHRANRTSRAKEVLAKTIAMLGRRRSAARQKGRCYSLLGRIEDANGDKTAAMEHFSRSLEAYARAKDQRGIAAQHANIGLILTERGDRDLALSNLTMARTLFEEIGVMHRVRELNRAIEFLMNGNWKLEPISQDA